MCLGSSFFIGQQFFPVFESLAVIRIKQISVRPFFYPIHGASHHTFDLMRKTRSGPIARVCDKCPTEPRPLTFQHSTGSRQSTGTPPITLIVRVHPTKRQSIFHTFRHGLHAFFLSIYPDMNRQRLWQKGNVIIPSGKPPATGTVKSLDIVSPLLRYTSVSRPSHERIRSASDCS